MERYLAQVVIMIAKPTVPEIVFDVKVTFPGIMGTIGREQLKY